MRKNGFVSPTSYLDFLSLTLTLSIHNKLEPRLTTCRRTLPLKKLTTKKTHQKVRNHRARQFIGGVSSGRVLRKVVVFKRLKRVKTEKNENEN
jgi:hypothetical protein